jgi:hypothetical protein
MWTNDRLPRQKGYDAECAAMFALALPTALAGEMLRGYVMLLSANLQGFCRDLYTECLTIIAVAAWAWAVLLRAARERVAAGGAKDQIGKETQTNVGE